MGKNRVCMIVVLTIFLLLSLVACGQNDRIDSGALVYVPEEVKFSSPLTWTESACVSGEVVYLLGAVCDSKTYEETLTLVRVPLEGGKAEVLPGFHPARLEGAAEYEPTGGYLRPGADGTLWLTERVYIPEQGTSPVLRQLDSEGNELSSFDGSGMKAYLGVESIHDLYCDGAGTIFANADTGVFLLDEDGAVQAELEGGEVNFLHFITLGDGRTAIPVLSRSAGSTATQLRVIDPEAGGWAEETFSLPDSASGFQDGDGDALFYYLDGDGLYAWRQGAKAAERVMSWAESGVDPIYMSAFAFLPDGRIAAVTGAMAGFEGKTELTLLTATDASALPERTVLTLATLTLSGELRSAVADFNKSSDSCFISVTEYPPAYPYGPADWEQAVLRMTTVLTAGKMPDILCLNENLPVRRMEVKGMLEDLWPYIDADPDLGRGALMLRPLEAMEYKGGLYRVADSFKIESMVGAASVVGDRMTWTYDDFWAALDSMPEGSTPMGDSEMGSRRAMLVAQVKYNMPLFLDLEEGICRFDSEEFRALLEFCSRFPEEPLQFERFSFDPIYYGEQMLYPNGANSFIDLQQKRALFGGEIAFVGWPNESGRVGSSFELYGAPLAICTSSEHKDESWSFLRQQLLPHEEVSLKDAGGSPNLFPINRQDFEQMVELSMTERKFPKEDSLQGFVNWFSSYQNDSMSIPYYPATQEEIDQFMALYNAAEGTSDYDVNLMSIITEQAGAYFAGDRSLDDTVSAIQSRVGLYLAELQ
jgi:hypothetical protein